MTVSAQPAPGRPGQTRPGTTPAGTVRSGAARLPSLWRMSLVRGGVEVKLFFRQRESVVFTFALPIILLVLFGQIFHGQIGGTGVAFRQYFIAGIVASGLMSATFVNLGVSVAADRDDGTLARLAATPVPPAAYFAGKAIQAMAVCLLEVAAMLAVGVGLLGLQVPATPGRWFTLAWVLMLGGVTCSLLGIAVASVVRTTRSTFAVLNLPYLVLSFISGVYFVFARLPRGLQQIAAVFPLKWICQGLRSAFLPDRLLVAEPARAWEHGRIALVLGAWLVASLVICTRTFRWQRQAER